MMLEKKLLELKKKKMLEASRMEEIEKRLDILQNNVKSIELSLDVLSRKVEELEKKFESLNLASVISQLMELISLMDKKIEEWRYLMKSSK